MNRFRQFTILAAMAAMTAACSKAQPPAPAPAPIPAAVAAHVTAIDVGRSVGPDKSIADKTDSFAPADTFYASVRTEGTSPSATIEAVWTYSEGQPVSRSSQSLQLTGSNWTEFHASKPDGWPAGTYRVEILLNGSSAGMHAFEVK